MDGKYLNDDELISTINRSSMPYIIIEGKDDVAIYRWILDDIDCVGMLEPRGGCDGVEKIFNRRNEITNDKVIFIRDKDVGVYIDEFQEECTEMIYTEGYSIENDLYQGKKIEEQLFEKEDKKLFSIALNSFLRYYACEIEKFKDNKEYDLKKKPEFILNHKDYSLETNLLMDFKEPSVESFNYINDNYDILLRGHSLFKLVRMILHRPKRNSKYEISNLYELCYKFCKSDSIIRMQNKIKQIINN